MNNFVAENRNGVLLNSTGLMEGRIDALKALADLLVREVESLKPVITKHSSYNPGGKISLSDEVQRFEEALIRDALFRSKGQQRKAASLLGIKFSTLHAKIKRYGIEPNRIVGKQ